jgi:hypothetical protein
MLRKTLLACGIASSVLYAVMTVVVARHWPGYDPASQTISELSAVGAPTRGMWMIPGFLHMLLVVAFGWGVWRSADSSRAVRSIGGLLLAYGALGLLWPFAPMHARETIAAGAGTITDTLHLVLSGVTVFIMIAMLGIAAAAFEVRFRIYTLATLAVLFVFGVLTSLDATQLAAGQPTPRIGVYERINIGSFLLWVIILAIALWPGQRVAGRSTAGRTAEVHA